MVSIDVFIIASLFSLICGVVVGLFIGLFIFGYDSK